MSLSITEHNPLQAVTWNNPNFDNNSDLTADVADTMHDNSTQILAINRNYDIDTQQISSKLLCTVPAVIALQSGCRQKILADSIVTGQS